MVRLSLCLFLLFGGALAALGLVTAPRQAQAADCYFNNNYVYTANNCTCPAGYEEMPVYNDPESYAGFICLTPGSYETSGDALNEWSTFQCPSGYVKFQRSGSYRIYCLAETGRPNCDSGSGYLHYAYWCACPVGYGPVDEVGYINPRMAKCILGVPEMETMLMPVFAVAAGGLAYRARRRARKRAQQRRDNPPSSPAA